MALMPLGACRDEEEALNVWEHIMFQERMERRRRAEDDRIELALCFEEEVAFEDDDGRGSVTSDFEDLDHFFTWNEDSDPGIPG